MDELEPEPNVRQQTPASQKQPIPSDSQWPASMAILPGTGMNGLNRRIKPIMKTAVDFIKVDTALVNAFPDYPHRAPYLLKTCVDAAEDRKDFDVAKRLREDEDYYLVFKAVVSLILIYYTFYTDYYQAREQIGSFTWQGQARRPVSCPLDIRSQAWQRLCRLGQTLEGKFPLRLPRNNPGMLYSYLSLL